MDAGLAALIGALVGGAASLLGTWLAEASRDKRERKRERDDRRRTLLVQLGLEHFEYMRARIRVQQRREILAAVDGERNPEEHHVRNNELASANIEHDDRFMAMRASEQALELDLERNDRAILEILETVAKVVVNAAVGRRPFDTLSAYTESTGAWHRGELSADEALARFKTLAGKEIEAFLPARRIEGDVDASPSSA